VEEVLNTQHVETEKLPEEQEKYKAIEIKIARKTVLVDTSRNIRVFPRVDKTIFIKNRPKEWRNEKYYECPACGYFGYYSVAQKFKETNIARCNGCGKVIRDEEVVISNESPTILFKNHGKINSEISKLNLKRGY